ncbi:hypothetical protein GCM10008983_20670 [Lentibacillus halophilus]|uniref:Peptidase S54 rhomboid domain-containing protein n=1 Tax=Lentibacillus halophilus TaxID=295065 RepID=A0ABN0ZCY2_9BACI
MDLKEKHRMYHLAYHLVSIAGFDVIDYNDDDIWMVRHHGKISQIARLSHGGFDWANHLKRDIAHVFQRAKTMRRDLQGKYIEIHNVYIADHEPVDDWNILKKPMQLQERHPINMYVYYLSNTNKEEELQRLQYVYEDAFQDNSADLSESDLSEQISSYQKKIAEQMKWKQQDMENLFTKGKPFITYVLLAVNVFLFLLLAINGGSTSTETLIRFGAKYNPAILEQGEWWRIVTSMFLHIGIVHLAMNMLAVFYLGSAVESIYGSVRFVMIYFLAGIGGGLASFAFTANISAGASGALFGLFGALLFFGVMHKQVFFRTMGMNVILLVGINIIFGLSVPQIDNGAHMGGLIAGFMASAAVQLPGKKWPGIQIPAWILYGLLAVGLIVYGVAANT